MSDGVLLTAHGTVENLQDIPAFLQRIRHGRPAPPELVAEIQRRYASIGGSPHLSITRAQGEALSARLGLPVYLGMRLWQPELKAALSQAASAGVTRLAVLPLAPFSVHVYARAAADAVRELGLSLELAPVAAFGERPAFVAAQVAAILPHLRGGPAEHVVLTAHSLPSRVVASGDPYADQVRSSAAAITAQLPTRATLAFQSQGADGGDWVGPELRDTLEGLAREGCRRVVIAPFGFLSDHVETLYDLDIEARGWAEQLNLEFERVPALNTSPDLVALLEQVSRAALFG